MNQREIEETKEYIRQEVAARLIEIEDIIKNCGLKEISKLTLLARDPKNEEMYICVSNERKSTTNYIVDAAYGITD